jgi:DNA-binding NarL/FixJ family response regulator
VPIVSTYSIIDCVNTSQTRVVLADDDVLLREGLAGLLERSGFEVVGQSGTPSELMGLVRELRPDLAIIDIRMPPTHTSEVSTRPRRSGKSSPRLRSSF